MKPKRAVVPVFVMMIVFSGSVVVVAGGDRAIDGAVIPGKAVVSPDSTPWTIETIDDDPDTRPSYISMAADSSTGFVHISYYDSLAGDLMMASNVGGKGNCGPGNTWTCVGLASDGDVGKYNTIATYPTSPESVDFIVAYYDANDEALKYATGHHSADSFTVDIYTIDTGIHGQTDWTGKYTSVQFDAFGIPHISYQNETYGSTVGLHIMYATFVGDGSGNCGLGAVAGDWECTEAASSPSYGSFGSTSLALDGSNTPVIAYYDQAQENPVVTQYVGSGGDCGTGSAWICRTVRQDGVDTGRHVSLFLDGAGQPHIAYQDYGVQWLYYARYVVSGGNCGYSSNSLEFEWQCDVIDTLDDILGERVISMAADRFGLPIIAYKGGLYIGPEILRIARPLAALGGGDPAVACGPDDTWSCETLDGSIEEEEADSVSLVVQGSGRIFVAYDEDSWVGPYEHNVKLARQIGVQIFGDGFESGNTDRWLAAVP